MVVGAFDDGVDPAPEPLSGPGLDVDLQAEELGGEGGGVIVAAAEAAALRQLAGVPAEKRRGLLCG